MNRTRNKEEIKIFQEELFKKQEQYNKAIKEDLEFEQVKKLQREIKSLREEIEVLENEY